MVNIPRICRQVDGLLILRIEVLIYIIYAHREETFVTYDSPPSKVNVWFLESLYYLLQKTLSSKVWPSLLVV